jgi:hypothetical protein
MQTVILVLPELEYIPARMGEEKKPFRFLTDTEFLDLPLGERANYLMRASHEIEVRQITLRKQLRMLPQEVKDE